MPDLIAKSRLTRGLLAVAAMAAVFYVLGNVDGGKRVVAAVATAVFAWIATCELEVFKTELSLMNKQADWKQEFLSKADSCLFDLRLVYEDVTTNLAFKPAGETDDQWHTRAAACWGDSSNVMNKLRRELWSIRSKFEKYEEMDTEIQNASQAIRGLILIHQDLMFKKGVYAIKDLISEQKELKEKLTTMDERFKSEINKMFKAS